MRPGMGKPLALSEQEIEKILRLFAEGLPIAILARRFSIGENRIARIVKAKQMGNRARA
jgi:hypothetical protein